MEDIAQILRVMATQIPYIELGGFDLKQFAENLIKAANRIKELERDYNCVQSLCNSMDEFGEPMKDTQWTELGERIYEIVAGQAGRIKELEKIAELALDLHTKDPLSIKKKWGVSGVQAEKLLCKMIEAQKRV